MVTRDLGMKRYNKAHLVYKIPVEVLDTWVLLRYELPYGHPYEFLGYIETTAASKGRAIKRIYRKLGTVVTTYRAFLSPVWEITV